MNHGKHSQGNHHHQQYGGYHQPQHQNWGQQPQQFVDDANRQRQEQLRQHFQGQAPLPPGWVEATDPNTGKIYYCNPKTRETKWERPLVSSQVIQENQPSPQRQDQMLPPGWVEATDPSSGKVYYCNPQTGETKWERPLATASVPLTTVSATSVELKSNRNTSRIDENSCQPRATNNSCTNTNQLGSLASTPSNSTTKTKANDDSGDDFDELRSMTTGQIAYLVKLQQRKRKEREAAMADEERQVDLSTIVANIKGDSSESSSQHKYVPIQLPIMSMLSTTERTEQGRLEVRMHALRDELKKFGCQQ